MGILTVINKIRRGKVRTSVRVLLSPHINAILSLLPARWLVSDRIGSKLKSPHGVYSQHLIPDLVHSTLKKHWLKGALKMKYGQSFFGPATQECSLFRSHSASPG